MTKAEAFEALNVAHEKIQRIKVSGFDNEEAMVAVHLAILKAMVALQPEVATPAPNTVRVRVAVSVTRSGWCAFGVKDWDSNACFAETEDHVDVSSRASSRHILTADLPIPEPVEIEAEVEDA